MTTTTVIPDFERGIFTAPSSSEPGVTHVQLLRIQGSEIRVLCSCTAGRMARHGTPVPCRHARAVCELVESFGLAAPDPDHDRWLIPSSKVAA
jgi:hypothetical protein